MNMLYYKTNFLKLKTLVQISRTTESSVFLSVICFPDRNACKSTLTNVDPHALSTRKSKRYSDTEQSHQLRDELRVPTAQAKLLQSLNCHQ